MFQVKSLLSILHVHKKNLTFEKKLCKKQQGFQLMMFSFMPIPLTKTTVKSIDFIEKNL